MMTDSGREVRYDEWKNRRYQSDGDLLLCSGESLDEIAAKYGDSGYGQFKKDLAEVVISVLEPLQQRFAELSEPGVIEEILAQGRARVEPIAQETLRRVKEAFGLVV